MDTVGGELKYPWPQIPSLISVSSVDEVLKCLAENPWTTVSEKLDGSNLCISSDNWIASRRRIIAVSPTPEELTKQKFCGQPLTNTWEIFDKAKSIRDELRKFFNVGTFELLLYGEWIQKGTATSHTDIYQYINRGFHPGHLYIFGMAVKFHVNLNEEAIASVKEELHNLKWNFMFVDNPVQYFVVFLNSTLEKFLKSFGMECVPLLKECLLRDVLMSEAFKERLHAKACEGFVLTMQGRILKWKAFEADEQNYQLNALNILAARTSDEMSLEIVRNLKAICETVQSSESVNLGPRKSPSRKLYSKLYNSAITKFQSIADIILNTQDDLQTVIKELRSYESMIYVEMSKDFIDCGYNLDPDYEEELKKFIRDKVTTSAKKILRKNVFLD